MDQESVFPEIVEQVKTIIASRGNRDEKLRAVCRLLENRIPHYHWVGFYLVDPLNKRELVLGPYVGEPTEHTRIKFGEGICGQAAVTKDVFIIQDVSRETNYLSCSPEVKSEIVLPVFKNNEFVGELDIDSNDLSPFTEADRRYLQEICEYLAPLF